MPAKGFNLLRPQKPPPTFWERMYNWMTTACRYIVVLVEIVVLGAFGARFYLDRKLNDLNEEAGMKDKRLRSFAQQEQEIRDLQDKLYQYDLLEEERSSYASVVSELARIVPSDATKVDLNMSGEEINLSGLVDSGSVSVLEKAMKNSSIFEDVVVSNIEEESGSDQSLFNIKARLAQ